MQVDGSSLRTNQRELPVQETPVQRFQEKLPPIVQVHSPKRETAYQFLQNMHSRFLWERYGRREHGGSAREETRSIELGEPGLGKNYEESQQDDREMVDQQRSKIHNQKGIVVRAGDLKEAECSFSSEGQNHCPINVTIAHAGENRGEKLQIESYRLTREGCNRERGSNVDKDVINMEVDSERIGINDGKRGFLIGPKKNGLLMDSTTKPENYEAEFTNTLRGFKKTIYSPITKATNTTQHITIPQIMNFSDEQLLAQFAALSADDDVAEDLSTIPKQPVRSRKWEDCLLMRVTSQNVINEGAFSAALRKAWNVHPDTVVEGLGSNYFLVQFLIPMEMLRIAAKGVWRLQKGDMVVTRHTKGQGDLNEPCIDEADCWVELHGIPPDSWVYDCVLSLMKQVGAPLTEVSTFLYGNKRVYRQKLKIKLVEPLKPKVPLNSEVYGIQWVYVVYENLANICRFCAIIGHEHTICPVKFRLVQMQQQEQYKERLGDKPIPETQVGK